VILALFNFYSTILTYLSHNNTNCTNQKWHSI